MKVFFSASPLGFFVEEINPIPPGSVEITEARYAELVADSYAGKTIQVGADGYPESVDTVFPPIDKKYVLINFGKLTKILMDETAASKGYGDACSACSYTNSTDPQSQSDAFVFIAWRDALHAQTLALANGDLSGLNYVSLRTMANALPIPNFPQVEV
jgi:hypothetical protein